MKGLKLSKTSWLILLAGVFIVVLAGLGLTRSQQLKEQTKVDGELSLSETTLGKLQTVQLSQQLENLRGKLEESEAQLKEAQTRLRQTVISVDVTEEFFKIAEYCSVNVTNLSTTTIAQAKYEAITCSTIALTASVIGKETNIINFIIGLNNGYTTGKVQSAQITVAAKTDEDETSEPDSSTASISMIIYSYEGK
jgi:hypothetical protein